MTLTEIENLKIRDVVAEIMGALLDPELLPEGQKAYWLAEEGLNDYDRLRVNDVYEKPTLLEINAEFDRIKAELIAIENARLAEIERVRDLKLRWNALEDKRAAFHAVSPDVPNHALWIKKALANEDHEFIESKMVEIETKDDELFAERQLEEEEKEARATELDQIKKAIDLINGSDLPVWHKKILRRLVQDLKE